MTKFWHPDPLRIQKLCRKVKDLNPSVVLDIGGNRSFVFPLATHVAGFEGDIQIDFCHERLPFEDQSVDFVFCRHTIEDLADPWLLLSEIRRVAKHGFLETPSPLAELSPNVDAAGTHLGYGHHRWICYDDRGVFTCLAKYPCCSTFQAPPLPETYDAWNTGFWFDAPLEFRILQHEQGVDMRVYDSTGTRHYSYFQQLEQAIHTDASNRLV